MTTEEFKDDHDGSHSIRLNVSGRTVHAALKNLLTRHYGITPAKVLELVLGQNDWKAIVTEWLNGKHFREFVSNTARNVTREVAEKIVREEVRQHLHSNINITVGGKT